MPTALRQIVGKAEIWRSLGTDSPTVALRRFPTIAANIERDFEALRAQAGLPADPIILSGPPAAASPGSVPPNVGSYQPGPSMTLAQVYEAYMSDPARDWSPKTRIAYVTAKRIALSVFGQDTPVRSISRADGRRLVEVLRWLPRNASKLYPGVAPNEIAHRAQAEDRTDLISAANINTYLNKLGGVFNWAVAEEMMDRNPIVGIKVADQTLRREKRLPFSLAQLRAIFDAPLYTGCRDDGHGYATPGDERPRNARFWIPLLSLFCGLRLNEACQLEIGDIRDIEGVPCIVVTASSDDDSSDKRLKTASSERIVPIHPELFLIGFTSFVESRRGAGETKLFHEVAMGANGYRSAAFSAWFARFLRKAGAHAPKTCFHSFRHVFRDALREARIDRDIALALGGWSRSGGSSSVADAYGSGYRPATLLEALGRVRYPGLDLAGLHDTRPHAHSARAVTAGSTIS